jgi:microcompartment protein CcmK/EutM
MYYGKVIGNIVSTIKVKNLDGQKIQIVRPIDMETGEPSEDFIVALDITSSGIGDYVGYEDGKEAAWAFEPKEVVTDATIVAIIDKVNIEKRK